MWVRFLKTFNWDIPEYGGLVTQEFLVGQVRSVRKECGETAIADKFAIAATESEINESRTSQAQDSAGQAG